MPDLFDHAAERRRREADAASRDEWLDYLGCTRKTTCRCLWCAEVRKRDRLLKDDKPKRGGKLF